MAHEFHSGLYIGKQAWHGLGNVLPEDSDVRFDVSQALEISGCSFEVEKVPTFLNWNGETRETGHFSTVRKDTGAILGNVGDRYDVLQTVEQFSWFQPFLETKEVAFEACIALRGGAVVSVLARILRDDEKVGNDHIRKYLLLASSHDGSIATNVGFTPIRVECSNRLSMAMNSKQSALFKIRHTKSQLDVLSKVRETIDLVDREFKATAEQYRKLADCGIKMSDLRKYMKLVMDYPEDESAMSTRSKNTLDRLIGYAIGGIGQSGDVRDLTAWTAYQGITEYVTHHAGRNGENRFLSGNFGVNAKLNERALTLAMQLAS
jgi:phage/plasmid-like protein (TIGR03299 family)